MQDKKKMWQLPWRYKESIAIISGIVTTGFILQLTIGEFDFRLMQFPVNLLAGGFLILFIIVTFAGNPAFCRWFSGVPNSVTLIGALMIMGVIMGLGLDNMTSSWPFVLVYFFTLLSLGMLVARRLVPFRWRSYAFYLNHIGLWVLLFSAGFGAADTKRYVIHVREGETEWRAYNDKGDILNLPVAIELNDFEMEEYPPKLAVIDRVTGAVLPGGNPQFFQLDEKRPEGKIGNWGFCLDEYIHNAVRNSDSTYQEAMMPGATPAARVTVRNTKTGGSRSGWVCGGNIAQLYMVLTLDDNHAVVMTKPEAKRFVSDINVYTENGRTAHTLLEVNKPLRIGHWMLYQYDYDKEAGRMSTYSSIELVYDPWIIPAYAGILMLMAGSVCLLWNGRQKKGGKK